MLMHPADELRGIKSSRLSNKKIVLGITGSIAAVECIKIVRELIRHGAEVIPVMTHAATKIIHPDALWFATGEKPIIQLTGKTEHVFYCGRVKDPVDLLLISPCTANTISKIAHGIDDTAVTTFATTAIGSGVPILIVPAMHISMYDHKIIQENIEKCKRVGIKFIEPKIIENKAKLAETDEIVDHVLKTMGNNDLSGKKILVIGGATAEAIDDVRVITNKSSGKTALLLAKNAFCRGA
ncbi:MAG: bifunctional phosphopantothenoylcysteine decarboxylase/phosphopantothenate--cysteine ligase CoaBC, partial [Candidatus Thermoplasmatota archaeon]|nr:bifunctional phosphopantothenoylcysteine decarboxylase/phosphopantothenate--cysteine ligase CoaBC [Candidatus Thermoplasmatota archaeon]